VALDKRVREKLFFPLFTNNKRMKTMGEVVKTLTKL
jgi:hypothetical protein